MQIEQVCRQSGDRRQTNRPEMRYMGIGVLDYTKSVYLHTNRNRLTLFSNAREQKEVRILAGLQNTFV